MPRRGRPDSGFTLAEVLVAMSVFSILVTVTLGMVLRTTGLLASNDRRVVAANLADRQIESARSQRAVDIPNGLTTRTETVGGVTYTVRQTATYVPPTPRRASARRAPPAGLQARDRHRRPGRAWGREGGPGGHAAGRRHRHRRPRRGVRLGRGLRRRRGRRRRLGRRA